MPFGDRTTETTGRPANVLAPSVRAYLSQTGGLALPMTYQALARALELRPPNTIHQLTMALECLIEEDAAAERPLIAALVISKGRGGLPAPGFFDCARRAGCFDGASEGAEGAAFYAEEFQKAVAFWRPRGQYAQGMQDDGQL
ncbi:hypothetical protein [Pseudophaeobacter leonis]|uniref:hypothetical protein n=1 Tax=Pseudophaeobacter leonis TaxID=1144477 RepID=UPI0009F35D31|nr:hypothetical protein [Pseudophaeobacter leonis]